MRISSKTDELANKFDATYPGELSAQLEWWSKTLSIDRPQLLRMIGMSARQAVGRKNEDLTGDPQKPDLGGECANGRGGPSQANFTFSLRLAHAGGVHSRTCRGNRKHRTLPWRVPERQSQAGWVRRTMAVLPTSWSTACPKAAHSRCSRWWPSLQHASLCPPDRVLTSARQRFPHALHSSPRTRYYRLTEAGTFWPHVLSGAGADFTFGGRYNRVQQKTVYAAEDPLVSIAEYAFHQALELQQLIGGGPLSAHPPLPSPPLPLVSKHLLWCFTLQRSPRVVDVETPLALQTFHHQSHELLNPSPNDYHRTAMLADLIRHFPNPQQPAAQGILAPSVRTPAGLGYTPQQYIFFVPHNVLAIPGTMVRRWKLSIEFKDLAAQSVTSATRDIDWIRPWFQLSGAHLPVPAYAHRPNSHAFAPGTAYQVRINFA